MGNASQQIGCRLGNTKFSTYKGEQGRACYNEHDAAGGLSRLHQKSPQVLKAYFLVNEDADKQAIDYGYGCCLSRGKDTTVNTAQNDDRH